MATEQGHREGVERRRAIQVHRGMGAVTLSPLGRRITCGPILAGLFALPVAAGAAGGAGPPAPTDEPPFTISGEVGLASLMSLADAHLIELADLMGLLAGTEAARTGEWERIRPGLEAVSRRAVSALNWFALPDGSYWSLQGGREEGSLAGRAYFPRVLAGQTVVGELVVSTATQRAVAIVAVPVMHGDEAVGVLGASVYLDRLSERIKREMGIGPPLIFFSFDAAPLVGLNWDPGLIFIRPLASDEPEVVEAFSHMLERERGRVSYRFRGENRTVLFRKSPVTGFWYAFGVRER